MGNRLDINRLISKLQARKKDSSSDSEESEPDSSSSQKEEQKIRKSSRNFLSALFRKRKAQEKEKTKLKTESGERGKGEEKEEEERVDLMKVDEKYPLIRYKHQGSLTPLAYAHIKYDQEEESLVYYLIEPDLNARLEKIVDKTISFFEEKVDIPLDKLKAKDEVYSYLTKKMRQSWELYNFNLAGKEELIVKYYVFRETLGLGKIEGLMHDPNIEDISCDGAGLPIYVFHRNPSYGELPTNIKFRKKEKLDNYVLKLAQKCGRALSVATPLMDGSLPDGSRVQITYGTEIARRGSNFTIRKFTERPLSPIDLINYGTINSDLLAYLWFLIEKQKSVLIAGSTAVGKTSMLNALSLFVDPNLKVVSIEDTAELRLPHPNWVPEVARVGFGPHEYGEVSMYDLLKSAMRQRPDYLIVGEVRGKEASVMFHAMNTGHPSFSTIHADRIEAVIDRLTTRPINLPMSLLETLDTIVFLIKSKKKGKFIRRLSQVLELLRYDREEKELETNEYAKWNPGRDTFTIEESRILERLPQEIGISEEKITEDIRHKKKIIDWMHEKDITDYRDVAEVIQLYYTEPEEVYEQIIKEEEEK